MINHVAVSASAFHAAVAKYSDKSRSDLAVFHEIYYASDGTYVGQFQVNVIDDGPDFYWLSPSFIIPEENDPYGMMEERRRHP